jgi:hypothetical protein
MSANIWHYLNISLVHEFTPWILSGELHSIYVMILLHDICVLFICNVYVLCNREQKRRTSSVLSKPASPRLWKNVTTAALEKVELQKLFGAFSISEKLFGAFRREYWDRDTYEVAFLFNQHALVTVLSYLLIQWHAEILFNHLYCGLLGNTSVHFVTLCRSLKETKSCLEHSPFQKSCLEHSGGNIEIETHMKLHSYLISML